MLTDEQMAEMEAMMDEHEAAEVLDVETLDSVANGWKYGSYAETKGNGTVVIYRKSPYPQKMTESEFDRETGENRAVASETGQTHEGSTMYGNPFYAPLDLDDDADKGSDKAMGLPYYLDIAARGEWDRIAENRRAMRAES